MSFFSPKISADDLGRVNRLEEAVESLQRRLESMCVDLDEFYGKVNKARQRVVKEERDAARMGPVSPEMDRAVMKSQLRLRKRG